MKTITRFLATHFRLTIRPRCDEPVSFPVYTGDSPCVDAAMAIAGF